MDAKALLKFGTQAMHQARYGDAEAAFRDAAEASRGEPLLHARALAALMSAVGFQGRVSEMGPPLLDALKALPSTDAGRAAQVVIESCLVRLMPPDHPQVGSALARLVAEARRPEYARSVDIARSLARLAIVCNARREMQLAGELLERALPALEAGLGSGSAEFAMTLYNYADVRATIAGSYDSVEPMLRRAIAIQESSLSAEHPEKAAPHLTLGVHLLRTGRHEEAATLFERALAIARAHEGEDGPTVGMARQAFAMLEQARGGDTARVRTVELDAETSARVEQARALAAQCRERFESGDAPGALAPYRRLRAIRDRLGEDARMVVDAAFGIPGSIYAMLQEGAIQRAETFLRTMLAVMEAALGPGHEERLDLLYFTGNVYRMAGRHEEALGSFRAALQAGADRWPAGSAQAVDVNERILDALLALGRDAEAARVADEIEKVTGSRPLTDAALNQIRRELGSIWQMFQLPSEPPLVQRAVSGDAAAQYVVGLCCEMGLGQPTDAARAAEWYRKAARQGHDGAAARIKGAGAEPPDLRLIAEASLAWLQAFGQAAGKAG